MADGVMVTECQQDGGLGPMKAIGFIETRFKVKNATPRQATVDPASLGTISILKSVFTNPQHSLDGLRDFSHVWLISVFHLNNCGDSSSSSSSSSFSKAKVRPPRLDGARVGIFSTRSPHRPNPIGLTLAKLDSVQGNVIHVSGIDLVDGTPIIDIKPYIPCYDRPSKQNKINVEIVEKEVKDAQDEDAEDAQDEDADDDDDDGDVTVADWIRQTSVGKSLRVRFTSTANRQLVDVCREKSKDVRDAIVRILSSDPRSVYRRNNCADRLYYCDVLDAHVTCWFDDEDDVVEVVKIAASSS